MFINIDCPQLVILVLVLDIKMELLAISEHSLEVDQPKFADCRNLLGPASSFRINIRAVAQYASDAGNGKSAFSDVDQCLRYDVYHIVDSSPVVTQKRKRSLREPARKTVQSKFSRNSKYNMTSQRHRKGHQLSALSNRRPPLSLFSLLTDIFTSISLHYRLRPSMLTFLQCLILDSLLQFVPSDVLYKGKAMADAYFLPAEELVPENLDPELKQLESIL